MQRTRGGLMGGCEICYYLRSSFNWRERI